MPVENLDPGTTVHILPDPDEDLRDPDVVKESLRPYVLLTRSSPGSDVVTLAYGSTRDTQAVLGAACIVVEPRSHLFHLTGFDSKTYIYPSRLVAALPSTLVRIGRLIDEFPELRDRELARALGYRSGTFEAGRARGTWRGLVLELNESGKEIASTTHAVVVTEPTYSLQNEFFNVIPVFETDRATGVDPDIVFPGSLPWVSQLGWAAALAGVRYTFALHYEDDILRPRQVVVDPDSMKRIDQAHMELFDAGWA